ncbi:hypothetical protein Trydic_g4779 [Trypoxylus dichotomus]
MGVCYPANESEENASFPRLKIESFRLRKRTPTEKPDLDSWRVEQVDSIRSGLERTNDVQVKAVLHEKYLFEITQVQAHLHTPIRREFMPPAS